MDEYDNCPGPGLQELHEPAADSAVLFFSTEEKKTGGQWPNLSFLELEPVGIQNPKEKLHENLPGQPE